MSDLHIDQYDRLPFSVNDFIGKSVAVLGTTGSGKSNTTAVLAEEFLKAGLPICIIDIAGEYHGLKEKHEIWSLGRTARKDIELPRPRVRNIINRQRQGDAYIRWSNQGESHRVRLRHTPHGGHTPTLDDLPKDRGIASIHELAGPTQSRIGGI